MFYRPIVLTSTSMFCTIRTPSCYPASHKRYLPGYRSDVLVPYREIALSAAPVITPKTILVAVYDCSGLVSASGREPSSRFTPNPEALRGFRTA
jgi:hypothetical protein